MKKAIIILILYVIFFPLKVNAGRGCCSWHGGQNYCDTSVGKWVCNDGTYSPGCTCQKDIDTSEKNKSQSQKNNNMPDRSAFNNSKSTNNNNVDIFYLIGGGGLAYYLIKHNNKKK